MEEQAGLRSQIPPLVVELGERVAAAGGALYIVGGWVRDRLMGRESWEVDLATSLTPLEMKSTLEGLGSVFDIGEKFGTVGLRADETLLEITTFRADEYEAGSRHPRVTPVRDIQEDLARRDFTINAMALSVAPDAGRFVDPFDGVGDIERRCIRAPGDPAPRMAEDPLRMMRAVRFAAQLDFVIEPQLLSVLSSGASRLDDISCERRREELERILVSQHPDYGIRTLVDTGLMDFVSPEVSAMKGVEQPLAYHRADVLEHTLLTVTYLPPDDLLRRAALFHDAGKPPTRVTEPKTMFPEHDKLSEQLTVKAMRRLRYGNEDIRQTAFLVRKHMRPIHYESHWSDAAVRRLIRDCTLMRDDEPLVPVAAVLELARADIRAGNEEKALWFLALVDELEERIDRIRAELEVEKIRSPLDGRELMELFGRGEGPWISEVKEHLVHLILEGELAEGDKRAAAERARDFMGSGLES
jgi:poly(A) polymerase